MHVAHEFYINISNIYLLWLSLYTKLSVSMQQWEDNEKYRLVRLEVPSHQPIHGQSFDSYKVVSLSNEVMV